MNKKYGPWYPWASGMVIQRGRVVEIRGGAEPGAEVAVRLVGKDGKPGAEAYGQARADGSWVLPLGPLAAGGPFELLWESGPWQVRLVDLWAGDVWLCSGQSNMVLPLARVKERFGGEIGDRLARGDAAGVVRVCKVPDCAAFAPLTPGPADGPWLVPSMKTLEEVSALAWFFARGMEAGSGVPQGLVVAAVGGSPVDAFLPPEDLEAFPDSVQRRIPFLDPQFVEQRLRDDDERCAAWEARARSLDPGLAEPAWFVPDADDRSWDHVWMPAPLEGTGPGAGPGVVWLRRHVDLPASSAGLAATLDLGTLVDADTVWVNGVEVGTTAYRYPPRRYGVPAGILRGGDNVVAVRLTMGSGDGGGTEGKTWELRSADGRDQNLGGWWRARRSVSMEALAERTFLTRQPSSLHLGMLDRVLNLACAGILWYQGESDLWEPQVYGRKMEALICSWRRRMGWKVPVLMVQLVLMGPPLARRVDKASPWAFIRQAQLDLTRLEAVGLVPGLDLGEWNDIHPENKRDLGLRLALLARRMVHGEDLAVGGPWVVSWEREDSAIRLDFADAHGGLHARGAEPDGTPDGSGPEQFCLAGPDGLPVRAEARIEGTGVVVRAEGVPEPAWLWHAWADNPAGASLWNGAGWPAFPFRLRLEGRSGGGW